MSRRVRGHERLLLATYPRRFRARHGPELLQTYRDACAAARGRRERFQLAAELLSQGWLARLDAHGRRPRRALHHSPRVRFMDRLLQDVRCGARSLVSQKMVTLVIVLTLALGIGANAAIFAVINAVLLRPLPISDPHELVSVFATNLERGSDRSNVSLPNLEDLIEGSTHITAGGAVTYRSRNLTAGEYPERRPAALVVGDLFQVLRLRPAAGRTLERDDEHPGAARVVVVAESFWRQRFDGDPEIVGTALRINGEAHAVVGVIESTSLLPADLFLPLRRTDVVARTHHFLEGIVRLAPGSTLDQARAEAEAVALTLARSLPETNAGWGYHLEPLHTALVGDGWRALVFLLGIVGVVLLIACVNVTNLLLARAADRRREIAVRAALGAGRRRILRQLLTESMLLAAGGALAGVGVAFVGVGYLRARLPGELPGLRGADVDPAVLAFTLAVALATGALFGSAPALHAARSDLVAALRSDSDGRDRRRGAPRQLLVVAEVGLAVALLVIAALLVDGLLGVLRTNLGFESEGRLVMRLDPPFDRYPPAALDAFVEELLLGTARIPGVLESAITSQIPMSSSRSFRGYKLEGELDPPPELTKYANWVSVTPGYFQTLGVRLRAGRPFDARDAATAQPVVIINDVLADELFGDADPIGRGVHVWSDEEQPRLVVGVLENVRNRPLGDVVAPQFYTPLSQAYSTRLSLVVRVDEERSHVVGAVRDLLRRIDADLPVYDVRSLDEVFAGVVRGPRVLAGLVAGFALLALALAGLGLYGVVAYAVARRTREIGIRMALGADAKRVRLMVVGQGMRPALYGALIGTGIATLAIGLLAGLIPSLGPVDPLTVVVVASTVLGATLTASIVPARRATRIDPLEALRSE